MAMPRRTKVQIALSGGAAPRKASAKLRPLLMSLAAACIPLALFASWMAQQSAADQRTESLREAQQTVDHIGEQVAAEISVQLQAAQTLASSTSLDEPSLATFYEEATRLKMSHPLWTTIELDDLNGAQVLNLLRPWGGAQAPTADRDSFDEVRRTGHPAIGGLGPVGAASGLRSIAIRVPVLRESELRWVFTIELAPRAVRGVLRRATFPPGWAGVVVDRRGDVIASSRGHGRRPGDLKGASHRAAPSHSISGLGEGEMLDGVPTQVVFETLSNTGNWSVRLETPKDVLNGPTRRAFYALGVAVLSSLTLAVGLTAAAAKFAARRTAEEGCRATQALVVSEERTALAIASAELGTWGWDVRRNHVTGSERCRLLLDLPRVAAASSDWSADAFFGSIHPSDRDQVRLAAHACIEDGEAFEANVRTVGRCAGARWLHIRGRAAKQAKGEAVEIYGIVADIGALKRAETERVDLLRRLANAHEDVQRRIARDLHDQVGQTVTGLSLGLKALERALDLSGDPAGAPGRSLAERVRWLQGLTRELGRDLNRAAADLRPAALDDLGLAQALDSMVADWSERYGVSADVQMIGDVEAWLPSETQTILYRVAQEALTNVLKHASARNVWLVFERRPGEVRLLIEDDGNGFDADVIGAPGRGATDDRRPLGLLGIRERLAMIGGALRIESSPGAGSALFMTVDLAALSLAANAA